MTTIDLHAHAIVPEALERMQASHPDFAPVLFTEGGAKFLRYPGRAPLGPIPEGMFDPERRLADMDRMKVGIQVIAVPPPNFFYHLPADVGVEFARMQNEALMGLSDDHSDRLHVFATLPLQNVDASLEELDRVSSLGRLRGVEIGSNVAGTDLDDPSLDPVWTALEDHALPVWIHPDQRSIAGAERLNVYYLQNLVGIPMESTIAIAKLIFGGVLERHPLLRFGVTHGGGFAPYQVGRWQHGWEVRSEPRVNVTDTTPRDLFSRLYFDSLTHDQVSLRMLGERMGWDHVVLGSDYPFDMAAADPVGAVESAGIDEEAETRILERNAEVFLSPLEETG